MNVEPKIDVADQIKELCLKAEMIMADNQDLYIENQKLLKLLKENNIKH
tara:strand:+ start:964 stop:1110 length:147 start_codon:yes stop_codon:yes gene_type:complete